MIKILVVDDQEMFRESFITSLKKKLPDAHILEASSGPEALGIAHTEPLDIVLLDVSMPGMNGLTACQKLKESFPKLKVVIVTTVGGDAMILHLYNAGADGFLFKNTKTEELLICLATVGRGERYLGERVQTLVLDSERLKNPPKVNELTEREKEIIQLASEGRTSKEIGASMGLTEKTVNSMREDIMKKTQTKNATQMVAFAFYNAILR